MKRNLFSLLGVMTLISAPAFAHTGNHDVSGLVSGFTHPLGGLDHLLAMIAVGILAAQMGGKSLWVLPLSFVSVMLFGGLIALAGVSLPLVETGIVGSVIILGAIIAFGRCLNLALAAGLTGLLGVFHGYAHGAEMPLSANAFEYALGFIAATALLHGLGILASMGANKAVKGYAPIGLRMSGGVIATLGLFLILQ